LITKRKVTALGFCLALLMAPRANSQNINQRNGIRRVLLVSVDGMHAVDYLNCVSGDYCPNLAALGKTGVN
jgi:hypothetical protein